MLPAFVFGWPAGDEEGDFLAVDLGKSTAFLSTPHTTDDMVTSRRYKPPCLPGHAWKWTIRTYSSEIPSDRRAETGGRTGAFRLLCRVLADVLEVASGGGIH